MKPISSMSSHRRWFIWLPLLGLTAWLALGAPEPESTPADDEVVQPVPRPAAHSPSPVASNGVSNRPASRAETALISRDKLYPHNTANTTDRDLFASIDWTPPPPPAPQPVAAEPVAPALPFSFLGKQKTETGWEVFLVKGETTFIVRESQAFADSYRVESIHPPQMTVTYLPLDQIQTLTIGASQ